MRTMVIVGHAANQVSLRAIVPARIKARFAGNGRSLAKERNAESGRHSGSRRAAAQAPWAGQAKQHGDFRKANEALRAQPSPVLHSLELARASPALARFAHDACATAVWYLIDHEAHQAQAMLPSSFSG